jgi:membrane dipeptidase
MTMSTDATTNPAIDAQALHASAYVVEGCDVSIPTRDLLERMQRSGLTAVHVTVAIFEDFKETMQNIMHWEKRLEDHSDILRPVRSANDIRLAKQEGRVGVIYGFQNTTPFEDEFGYINLFRKVGVRIVQLAYMYQNLISAGCLEDRDSGLTSYGRDVVKELNRHNLLIDLSHCGPKTTLEAIEASTDPVVFTHTAAHALCDSPRNRTDEELRMVADKGGVIGVVAFPSFVAEKDPTIEQWLGHLDYIVERVGPQHVAIGTDFIEGQPDPDFAARAYFRRPHPPGLVPHGWPWPYPEGIASVDDYPNVTEGLVRRGYGENDIRGILGENWLRIFAQVWDREA